MRRLATQIHRYAGLLFGTLLLISSVTGMLIVFAKPIDAGINNSLLQVSPLENRVSIDALLEGVREAAPARTISSAFIPQSRDLAWEFWFQEDDHFRVYANPYTGAVTGMREETDSLMGFLIDLHIHLLAGDIGERVMGWAGLAGIFITLIGIYLWWPKKGNWKKAFTIKWQAAPIRVWLDIHKVVGVCMSALIVLTIATGSALALYDIITEPILKVLTGEETREPPPVSKASEGVDASIAPMVEQAKRVFPEGHVSRISFPASANGPVVIRMRLDGEVHQVGRTFLFFDRYDGSLLKSSSAFEANSAVRIQNWLYPLHTGFYGGTATRVLQIIVGLSLASLVLSGAWLWWRGWRARRAAAARSLRSEIRA
jgi:uncharacterized iron-regulated membrane protein